MFALVVKVGVAVVSREGEAIEPDARNQQKLWEMMERSEQFLSNEEKTQLFALSF